MGSIFFYRMPTGIVEVTSRPQDLTTEPQLLDSSNLFPAYSLGGKIPSGKFVPIAVNNMVSVLVGIYVRPCPAVSQSDKVQQVDSGKNSTDDCLVHGYVTVNIGADVSSIVLHDPVHMRAATPPVSDSLSTFLVVADGSSAVQATSAYLNGPGDTSGNIELAFDI